MMNIEDIKRQPISELAKLAKELEVAGASGMRRQDLIFSILQAEAEKNGALDHALELYDESLALHADRDVAAARRGTKRSRSTARACSPAGRPTWRWCAPLRGGRRLGPLGSWASRAWAPWRRCSGP